MKTLLLVGIRRRKNAGGTGQRNFALYLGLKHTSPLGLLCLSANSPSDERKPLTQSSGAPVRYEKTTGSPKTGVGRLSKLSEKYVEDQMA